jgi:hypothetical protein
MYKRSANAYTGKEHPVVFSYLKGIVQSVGRTWGTK